LGKSRLPVIVMYLWPKTAPVQKWPPFVQFIRHNLYKNQTKVKPSDLSWLLSRAFEGQFKLWHTDTACI